MSEQPKQTAQPKQNPLVDTIMTSNVHSVHLNMTVKETIELLVKHRISGAPIVDSNNRVLSVLSEGDLLKLVAAGNLQKKIAGLLDLLVKQDRVVTARKSESFLDLYKKFLQNPVHRIVVVDGTGKLQGIVSRSNVLRLFAEDENIDGQNKSES